MQKRAALFVTCLTDQFYPRTGIAITKILEKLGWSVEFPPDQTCCGQPFYNNGFTEESARLARRFIEIFEPFDYIVTPSGSCCAMVREQFHQLFHNDAQWAPRMENVRHKTFEFVEFLTKVVKFDPATVSLPETDTFTYHYTCHLRSLGIHDEGVEFLRKIGNVDFKPMNKADQCCGFGGTFAIKYPAISGAMVQDKLDNLKATGAATTICNDAGCTMNIAGMCNRHQVKTNVTHIAEVMAKAMKIELPDI